MVAVVFSPVPVDPIPQPPKPPRKSLIKRIIAWIKRKLGL